jgi:ABC-2 type transport system ATP-binding protein
MYQLGHVLYFLITEMKGSICCMAQIVASSQQSSTGASRSGDIVLQTRALSKHYGQRVAVDHLTIQVQRGEIFGFLGPNGAGKTTTIRMLLGLITPTDGSAEMLGMNVISDRARVLPRVGALIETPALQLYLSGRDNLRAVAHILGHVSEARIDAVLEQVALKGRDKDRVRTYSLGMKQRLGVAIALLNNPDLLILDEPANGLDPAGIVEMRDLMRTLATQGKTVFISSHVLTEVQQICTRVAIISNGKLITESTIEDLTRSRGIYRLRIDDTQNVLSLIQRQPWGSGAHIDHGDIITQAPEGRGRYLIQFLAGVGLTPDEVAAHQEQLEDVFLRLTGNGGTH